MGTNHGTSENCIDMDSVLCRGKTESCLASGLPAAISACRLGIDYINLAVGTLAQYSILVSILDRMTPKGLYNQSYFSIHPVSD